MHHLSIYSMPATNINVVFTRQMLSAIYALQFSDFGEEYVIKNKKCVYNLIIVSTDICQI
jgi:hypothetical protein